MAPLCFRWAGMNVNVLFTVNWKDGPTAQPSLQAGSVRRRSEESGCGQLCCVGLGLPETAVTALNLPAWKFLFPFAHINVGHSCRQTGTELEALVSD